MKSNGELQNDSNETGVQMVMPELDRALSFLYVTGTSYAMERQLHGCQNRMCRRNSFPSPTCSQRFTEGRDKRDAPSSPASPGPF